MKPIEQMNERGKRGQDTDCMVGEIETKKDMTDNKDK